MNCKLVLSLRSQFFHSRLFFSSQAKLRSTTQRLGMTLKVCSSLRLAICTVTCPPIRAQDTPDTLFFVDPPYVPSTRSKSGYRHEMSEADHVALLDQLRSVRGMVVLAGYPSKLYDDNCASSISVPFSFT